MAGAVLYDSSTSAKLDSLTEAAAPGVAITKACSIAFADADAALTDIHTVGPVSASQGALGTLSPSVATHTTDPAAAARSHGTTAWTRQQSNTWPPATKVESFTFTLCDGHGGGVARTVHVTITGTNDRPVITSAPQAASVTEMAERAAGENASNHLQEPADADVQLFLIHGCLLVRRQDALTCRSTPGKAPSGRLIRTRTHWSHRRLCPHRQGAVMLRAASRARSPATYRALL